MKKNTFLLTVLLMMCIFIFSCNISAMAIQNADDAKRAKMCKERCDKKHYNITIIRATGKIEKYKINIVDLEEKLACECVF